MNPLDKNEIEKNIEDSDFDQEKVWKKIFKKVECEFCSDDGDCSYPNIFQGNIMKKCPKWDDFELPCLGGGINTSTINISWISPRPFVWGGSIGASTTFVWNSSWTVSYGT